MSLKDIYKKEFWKKLIYFNFTQNERDMWDKGFEDGWHAYEQSLLDESKKSNKRVNRTPDDGC